MQLKVNLLFTIGCSLHLKRLEHGIFNKIDTGHMRKSSGIHLKKMKNPDCHKINSIIKLINR